MSKCIQIYVCEYLSLQERTSHCKSVGVGRFVLKVGGFFPMKSDIKGCRKVLYSPVKRRTRGGMK